MSWSDYDFGDLITQFENKKTANFERNPISYQTTVNSLITFCNYMAHLKKRFEHPVPYINVEKAEKLHRSSLNTLILTTEEESIIETLKAYANAIANIRNNFQKSVFERDEFQYSQFKKILEVFPSWNIFITEIKLEINDEHVNYTAKIGDSIENWDKGGIAQFILSVESVLTDQFQKLLPATREFNKLMDTLIDQLDAAEVLGWFKMSYQVTKSRNNIFKKLGAKVENMKEIIKWEKSFNKNIYYIFSNIESIAMYLSLPLMS